MKRTSSVVSGSEDDGDGSTYGPCWEFGEDATSSDASDDSNREWDYPDDEPCSENDGSEDDRREFSGVALSSPAADESVGSDVVILEAACSVCQETLEVFPYRLDEMDHHPETLPSPGHVLFHPCQRHATCVTCLKTALLQNTVALLRDGQGAVPCLGDSQCRNALQQRTTTVLSIFRDWFSLPEWNSICQVSTSTTAPRGFHPYVVPVTAADGIQPAQAYAHLQHLWNQDEPRVQCPICLVVIQKTTACFALRHCDWEMCWMCGRIDRRLPLQHWKTCPRYDSHVFWQRHGFVCTEGECFDETRTCNITAHAEGRRAMDRIRQAYQVVRFYESLTPACQTTITNLMQTRGEAAQWAR